nr:uncharacterized protein LOC109168299 [Ipomoea batatas]
MMLHSYLLCKYWLKLDLLMALSHACYENRKELGTSSDVLRVHKNFKRNGVTRKSGQRIKILKGACAGFHWTNTFATLEFIILEGWEGDVGVNDAEWESQLQKHHHETTPSSIEVLDANHSLDLDVSEVINTMSSNRYWMYTRIRNGLLTEEFLAGLETFIQFATSQPSWMDGEKIKCPCNQRKCQNTKFLDVPTVKFHLAKYGFVSDYYVWRFHGEANLRVDVDQDVGAPSQIASEEASNAYHTMVMDAAGPEFNVDEIEESPNPEAQKFYDMLKAADQELWPGSKKHSQLSVVARLMSLKSENHISEKCFNQFTELMKEVAPEDNLVPENFYETKKLLRGMGKKYKHAMMLQRKRWKGQLSHQL